MIDLERLRDISDLACSEQEWKIKGVMPDECVKKLVGFIDGFPALEKELRAALAEKNAGALSESAAAVSDMLIQIHANKIAEECLEKIKAFKTMDSENLEAYIEKFLSDVSSLSIDIQMAVYSESGENTAVNSSADGENRQIIILAVDDNAFFLNTLKSYLQDPRYKLICVTSGNAALRFLEKNTPDLFILDIDMPEMDGYELADKIQEKGKKSPIIFLTGNATKEYVLKAIKAGASDFLVKPIDKNRTLNKIAKYLQGDKK